MAFDPRSGLGWPRRSLWWGVRLLVAIPGVAKAERVVYLNADPTVLVNTGGQDPTLNSYDTAGFVPGAISGCCWMGKRHPFESRSASTTVIGITSPRPLSRRTITAREAQGQA